MSEMHSSPLLKVSFTSSSNNIGMTLPKSQSPFFFFEKTFSHSFIFGHTGFLLLRGLSLVAVTGATL